MLINVIPDGNSIADGHLKKLNKICWNSTRSQKCSIPSSGGPILFFLTADAYILESRVADIIIYFN